MANDCFNRLILDGRDDDIDRFLALYTKNADGNRYFDFSKLVPIPTDVDHQSLMERLDWFSKKWGTRSNSYDCQFPTFVSGPYTFFFDTKSTPPVPIVHEASRQYPHLNLDILCKDEMSGFWGHGLFLGGRGRFKLRYYDVDDDLFRLEEQLTDDELIARLAIDRPNDKVYVW